MDGKTVIITGGNGSLGKATANELAQKGARVILACRNLHLGKEVQDELIRKTSNQNILLKQIDLASQKSIRKFAAEIIKEETRLDVLIHNAAVISYNNVVSEDGLELNMAINHFGPFLLTHLLIDLLKRSAPSRIIVVSSVGHHIGWVDANSLNNINSFLPSWNYLNSKLVNICFIKELARRLKGSKVTANCIDPKLIESELWRPMKTFLQPTLFNIIVRPFLQTPEEACGWIVYLTVSEKIANVSGEYFRNHRVAWAARGAANAENCEAIWKKSQEILNFEEKDCLI